jgi:hypothetical protein
VDLLAVDKDQQDLLVEDRDRLDLSAVGRDQQDLMVEDRDRLDLSAVDKDQQDLMVEDRDRQDLRGPVARTGLMAQVDLMDLTGLMAQVDLMDLTVDKDQMDLTGRTTESRDLEPQINLVVPLDQTALLNQAAPENRVALPLDQVMVGNAPLHAFFFGSYPDVNGIELLEADKILMSVE